MAVRELKVSTTAAHTRKSDPSQPHLPLAPTTAQHPPTMLVMLLLFAIQTNASFTICALCDIITAVVTVGLMAYI